MKNCIDLESLRILLDKKIKECDNIVFKESADERRRCYHELISDIDHIIESDWTDEK